MTVAGTWGQGVWAMLIELLTFVSLGIFFFFCQSGGPIGDETPLFSAVKVSFRLHSKKQY